MASRSSKERGMALSKRQWTATRSHDRFSRERRVVWGGQKKKKKARNDIGGVEERVECDPTFEKGGFVNPVAKAGRKHRGNYVKETREEEAKSRKGECFFFAQRGKIGGKQIDHKSPTRTNEEGGGDRKEYWANF